MHSFRRLAFVSALALAVLPVVFAQSTTSNPPASAQSSSSQAQQTPEQMSVQARIRMRREQRRTTAIHDAYDHRFDAYIGLGYLRDKPGPNLQNLTYYGWTVGLTRYSSERMGIAFQTRGYLGDAYIGQFHPGQGGITRPKISQYDLMIGPTYRFYVQPRYSVALRGMAGWALGNFSGDINGYQPQSLGLYPDGSTFAASGAILGEYNVTPGFALQLAPEYFFSGFGSSLQAVRGFTGGVVYRFGRQ
jgi:hypothetical protein